MNVVSFIPCRVIDKYFEIDAHKKLFHLFDKALEFSSHTFHDLHVFALWYLLRWQCSKGRLKRRYVSIFSFAEIPWPREFQRVNRTRFSVLCFLMH